MARISKEEQARIRKKIVEVAAAKFSGSGYEEVSTKQIAKEVGIAEGTLFNYFDSKTHLFLEVFSEQFVVHSDAMKYDIDPTKSIVDIIYNQLLSTMSLMLKLPKKLSTELIIASIKMAKKHPERFKKFVELDFKYIQELELFLRNLTQHQLLDDVNEKDLSQLIYSVVMYEYVLYMYDNAVDKNAMLKNVYSKIKMVIAPYIIGGQNGN